MVRVRSRLRLAVLVVSAALLLFCSPWAGAATTVVVVRHAEKVGAPGDPDPALTEAGHRRAAALSRLLSGASVRAVYSSDTRRTRDTAAPVAARFGLDVGLYDPRRPGALREEILRDHSGGAVVVVGHSNTVPAMLGALGVSEPPAIGEEQYDDCFVVFLPESAEGDDEEGDGEPPTLLRLRYGEPTPRSETETTPETPQRGGAIRR